MTKSFGLLVALILIFCLQAHGQTYYQLSTVSGTETDGGVTITITPFGTTDGSSFCGGSVSPYFTATDGSGATYTFSSPVSSVQLPTQFGGTPPFTSATYYINGSLYPLTSANLIGITDGECTNGLAEVSGGLLDNNVVPTSPSGIVQINGAISSVTIVLNFSAGGGYASWGLFFSPGSLGFNNGTSQTSLICQDAMPKSVNSLLLASDVSGATLTWSVLSGPSHGTLSGFPATASAGTNVAPSGTTYLPAYGYTGADAYTIQVSDGTNTATTTINVTVGGTPPAIVLMTGGGGYCVGDTGVDVGLAGSATGILYQLYYEGISIGAPFTGYGYLFNFGPETGAGTYTATATDPVSGCSTDMSGTETVIIYPVPNIYEVTGGGDYCSGGGGVTVGVSNSDVGINYRLYLGGVPILGAVVAGTGGAISFAPQTVSGVYTVLAKNASFTGCTSNMTGSAVITVDPLPTMYEVTGGGSYCEGGDGVAVGLSNSDAGINYRLYLGSVAVGTPFAGTGSAISFGLQTTSGTYTVNATNATTGCMQNMSGSANIAISPLPVIYTVTGGGNYCFGVPGAVIGLSGSTTGVNYQLYQWGAISAVAMGSPVTGTGSAISFGLQPFFTFGGGDIYDFVVATNLITGCSDQTVPALALLYPALSADTMTGGGQFCPGSAGVAVGLNLSDPGVNYQLYKGGASVGGPVAGTGAAISFGVQSTTGTYTAIATNVTTGCTATMVGSAIVSVNTLPAVYAVTGGGSYCPGGTGVTVGLSNSQTGVNYQLFHGTTSVGSPVAGTGSAISFGLQSTAGTYTAIATNTTTACVSNMTGSATISITALPTSFTMTGGGGYCAGGAGFAVGLSGSQAGVNYQLYSSSVLSGSPIPGTGAALTFGTHTVAGTYTAVGTTATGGCINNMTGSVTIAVNPLPNIYTVTGGGSYCSGGTGSSIGLSNSDAGISYQLYRGTTLVGSAVVGTGSNISFGSQTIAGTYTIIAKNSTTLCTSNMSGSAVVSTSSFPAIVAVTGGGNYCAGATGVHIGLSGSVSGVNYQLWRSGTPVGSSSPGIGGALDFGLQTIAGTYTATASNSAGCTSAMTGSANVYLNTLPTAFSITGGGSYCSGGTGVHIGLSGSTSGYTYKLYAGGTPVGTVTGTGTAIDFGLFTATASYSIVGTASGTACTNNMYGSVSVSVNPNPTVSASIYTVAPAGTITLTGSIGGGTWTSSATRIATIGLSTGIVTGVALGTDVITYTLPTGCFGVRIINVTTTGHRESNTTGITSTNRDDIGNITVAPNPNHGLFTVKGSLGTQDDEVLLIQVTNMLGQVEYTSRPTIINGEINETIQLSSSLANGMYLLTMHWADQTKVEHIAVQQ